jgi:hypothetical protein
MWLVQYAGMRNDNTDTVMLALKAKGVPFTPVGIRPFTSEIMGLEGVDLSGPVMAYGSCKLVKLVGELGLRPGVFFDYSTFNAMAWKNSLDVMMANDFKFCQISTLHDASILEPCIDNSFFVRPVMDLKAFSGSVKPVGVTFEDFFAEKFNGAPYADYKNIMVAVTVPQVIEGEWRCFIVNRKLVTASQYRIGGELKSSTELPKGLEAFVAHITSIWLPHDHCVMDVAMIGGAFKVLEFNCINASGLYAADVNLLVDSLNSLRV